MCYNVHTTIGHTGSNAGDSEWNLWYGHNNINNKQEPHIVQFEVLGISCACGNFALADQSLCKGHWLAQRVLNEIRITEH